MYLNLKTESFAKLFCFVSCTGLILYTILGFYTFHTAYSNLYYLQKYQSPSLGLPHVKEIIDQNLKYILIWSTMNETANKFGEGIYPFIDNKCIYTNCILSTNKHLLNEDYKNFDAIIFNVEILKNWKKVNLPLNRSSKQKYIFYSSLSSDDNPVCNIITDEYFNWTCTYKLDSDIVNPFLQVTDLEGNLVAPKTNVTWQSAMIQLTDRETRVLKNRKKAMAWIVNKCITRNSRILYARMLQKAFQENSLVFDIYGCGFLDCKRQGCMDVLRDYYFYFAAEDSDADDYVTKEVLKAYNSYTVPIVKGGADYQRFLPEGSYINADTTSMERLVALVDYSIRNPAVYYNYHRWRKYYKIKANNPFDGMCKICEYLNDINKLKLSVKNDFRKWWHNKPLFERCFPKSAESLSFVLSYANSSKKSRNRI